MGRQLPRLAWSPDLGISVIRPLLIPSDVSPFLSIAWNTVPARHFALWHSQDGVLNFFQGEVFYHVPVCLAQYPNTGTSPAFLPCFLGAGGMRF
jgi:hypothetical protein